MLTIKRMRSTQALALALATLSSLVAGCASSSATRDGEMDRPPRDRLGSLPFPGTFTLYRVADIDRLGLHRYERPPRLGREDEGRHGLIYTTRAGFLDVGHMRITIDHVRFCAERVRQALREQAGQLELPTIEGSTFFVTLRYPLGWPEKGAETPADEALADELAIRTGQRLAYLMMTWHEIVTWYGWSTVPGLSEQRSAFTWDDTMSHVIGLRVAGRALRDMSGAAFDEAVTRDLREDLIDLGACSPQQTRAAVAAVDGVWYARGAPLKRQLDIGLSDDTIRPWLVHGLPFAPDTTPGAYHLPSLTDVAGHDFTGFFTVRIDPNIPEAPRLRAALPGDPAVLCVDRDFPLLLTETRREMRRQISPNVDVPWPTIAPPTVAAAAPPPALGNPRHQALLSWLGVKQPTATLAR
jgi:hypothetical protein